eukprot:TRINITY_DN3045_c0_g1_i1.p1 TRINITY_DN3045_c0_g1~~TRINITY_DN3045_c0_g1_i1.p1  ORF type:complete len:631 (+),score=96.86 TRINITY_DN3045_c0_g1_i1:41-1933(+)
MPIFGGLLRQCATRRTEQPPATGHVVILNSHSGADKSAVIAAINKAIPTVRQISLRDVYLPNESTPAVVQYPDLRQHLQRVAEAAVASARAGFTTIVEVTDPWQAQVRAMRPTFQATNVPVTLALVHEAPGVVVARTAKESPTKLANALAELGVMYSGSAKDSPQPRHPVGRLTAAEVARLLANLRVAYANQSDSEVALEHLRPFLLGAVKLSPNEPKAVVALHPRHQYDFVVDSTVPAELVEHILRSNTARRPSVLFALGHKPGSSRSATCDRCNEYLKGTNAGRLPQDPAARLHSELPVCADCLQLTKAALLGGSNVEINPAAFIAKEMESGSKVQRDCVPQPDGTCISSPLDPVSGVKGWDFNWDGLMNTPIGGERVIILARHGQCENDGAPNDANVTLSPLGREQAQYTANSLKKLGIPISAIYSSTLTRAMETAGIIRDLVSPDQFVISTPLLMEGYPTEAVPCYAPGWCNSIHPYAREHDPPRFEQAFRTFFKRNTSEYSDTTYEVIVTHENMLVFLLLRALQLPPQAYMRFFFGNATTAHIHIRPNGLVTFEVGEGVVLPPRLRSFNNVPANAEDMPLEAMRSHLPPASVRRPVDLGNGFIPDPETTVERRVPRKLVMYPGTN